MENRNELEQRIVSCGQVRVRIGSVTKWMRKWEFRSSTDTVVRYLDLEDKTNLDCPCASNGYGVDDGAVEVAV